MANYTEYYHLHQWEPEDSFLRTDFNGDFQRLDEALAGMDYIPYTPENAEEFFAQIEQWNDEEAKRAYEAAGGKPAFTGSAAEGAQNGGVAISFAAPTKAAKTGDTDAANVAVAAGVADDTDVEPDVTNGEQA